MVRNLDNTVCDPVGADHEPEFTKSYLLDETARLPIAACSENAPNGLGCSVDGMYSFTSGSQKLPLARDGYAFYPALHTYRVRLSH